ncbi:CLUMA_CG009045, isoform A [Clunio marinus]|uniref:CLUMA_CG009045, isoform A n=1 Tax=Clunio marinus TaxID=568069 RepID=A0A1J1I5N3_9DIPT|nr:CLUMA_CG009045, isoform A [Clunio marinus]
MNSFQAGCVLFIATASLCFAQRAPFIAEISEDQEVGVGGAVELTCSVSFLENYSVIWVKMSEDKNEQMFLSVGSSLVIKDVRFSFLADPDFNTYTVFIRDVQPIDAGTYQCQVILSIHNKITADTNIFVNDPPVISDNSSQSIVTVEGESVTMECYATGFPTPKIVWRRENSALLPTGNLHFKILHDLANKQFNDEPEKHLRVKDLSLFLKMTCLRAGCILLIATVSLCNAQRFPSITYISGDQEVEVGRTAELACSVTYGTEFSVIWSKVSDNRDDQVFLSTGTSRVIKDSRLALLYDGASATYTVLIRDVQEGDAGTYLCEIVLSVNNKISQATHLYVKKAPIITHNSTQSIVTTEGESVIMECYATGFPQPKIIWRRDNNALLPSGGNIYNGNVMKFNSITKEDRGTYYCIAENGVGRGDRRNINLEIEFSPVITVPQPKLGQALRYDIDLQCHVEAYPPPQIIWVKDEFLISNSRKYKVSNFGTADEFTDSTLRIVKLDQKQFGDYKCKAVNKLGSDEAVIHLYEANSPVCPPACGQEYNNVRIPFDIYFSSFLISIAIILQVLR